MIRRDTGGYYRAMRGCSLRAGLGLAAALTLACHSTERHASRVVIGIRADPGTVNVYTATNATAQEVADLLFLRLADEQDDAAKGPPTLAPSLARSWEWEEDGRALRVHLDPKATWSDGRQVTSEDVVFSDRAARSPDVGWVGADVKELISEVTAPDATTVVFRFTKTYPYRLLDASEGNIVPAHAWGTVPLADWPKHAFVEAPATTGPFRLGRYVPKEQLQLTRNPSYLNAPLPRLDEVVFRILPDMETLVNEVIAGGVDVVPNISEEASKRLQGRDDVRVVRAPDLSYTFVCWNTSRAPFEDASVRRALTLSIDRRAIIETLAPGTGRPSYSPIPSALWAHDDGVERLDFDPAAAAKLLEEAGWVDRNGDGIRERNGKPFRFELETNQGSALRGAVVEMIATQLLKVGVEAVPRLYEFGASNEKHRKHDFDAFVGGWRESTKVDLKSVLHSSAREGGYNFGLYENAELDALIDRARGEPDVAVARDLWSRAQRIVAHDQPFTFLFEADRLHAVRKGLEGFHPTLRSALTGLEEWRWER
jgi:peptide/nickel transport system substrate-binding protein